MSNSGGKWGCREQVKVNPTRGCPPGVGVYMAHIQNPRPRGSLEAGWLNSSIRHQLSGEGSGGELERWVELERSAAAAPEPTPVR